jgi:hypothetical protein
VTLFFRLLVTLVSGVSAFYFVFWVGGALLVLVLHAPGWLWFGVSLLAALAAGHYVWMHTASLQGGLVRSVVLGALATGAVGFAAGFFGPLLLAPDANQGPLLGTFITGPLGVVAGAIGGAVHWLTRGRPRAVLDGGRR